MAEHCWESNPSDQTRFTVSIIETRAADQTDTPGVFSGKHEGKDEKKKTDVKRITKQRGKFCDRLTCRLSNSRDQRRRGSKIC